MVSRFARAGARGNLRLRRHHGVRRTAQAAVGQSGRLGHRHRLRWRPPDRHRTAVRDVAADALKSIVKQSGNNVAGVIDFVASDETAVFATGILHRGGQGVIVGLFGGELRIPVPMFSLKSLSITGSSASSLNDLRDLVALAQRTTLPVPRDHRRLMADVSQALDDPGNGRVVERMVLQI